MSDNNAQPPPPASRIPVFYYLETALKMFFFPMSLFNLKYTLVVALAASVMALFRVRNSLLLMLIPYVRDTNTAHACIVLR